MPTRPELIPRRHSTRKPIMKRYVVLVIVLLWSGSLDASANQADKLAPLIESLTDKDPAARQKALEEIEKLSPELYDPLVTLVVDKAGVKHIAASKKIAELGPKGLPAVPLIRKHVEMATQAYMKDKSTVLKQADLAGFQSFHPGHD